MPKDVREDVNYMAREIRAKYDACADDSEEKEIYKKEFLEVVDRDLEYEKIKSQSENEDKRSKSNEKVAWIAFGGTALTGIVALVHAAFTLKWEDTNVAHNSAQKNAVSGRFIKLK